MNILCTGNPAEATVASAVKNCFPAASFASRTSGYDFTLATTDTLFEKNIVNYDVLVNTSYIQSGIQLKLLNMTVSAWMKADIKGHIITLGSTIEWTDNTSHTEYVKAKQQLRQRSLELSDETGITGVKTTYLILGGVNDGKPGNENYVSLPSIGNTIQWILKNPDRVPLIQLESAK